MPAPRKTDDAQPEARPKSGLWEALTNLSISRSGDKEKMADIVHKGETVTLTEEQSKGFLHRHRKPVIRPASDRREPDPGLKARDLFGRPPGPPADARPDPPADPERSVLGYPLGASQAGQDPEHERNAPEANDPPTDLSVDPDAAKDK